MGEEISRRDLLTRFHRLVGRSLAEAGRTVGGGLPGAHAPAELRLPAPGAPLEGIPFVHPWIGLAHALGDRLSRRYPYLLLLGASGEAFRIAYRRDAVLRAFRRAPVNPFLAALAVCGLTARATHGGSFSAALGGIEVEVGRGLAVVVGTRAGPAAILAVLRKQSRLEWLPAWGGDRTVSFDEFEREWEGGWWSAGAVPFLRIAAEKGAAPRALDDVARVGLETMAMLLTRQAPGEAAEGLAAYEAWAEDLRAGAIAPEQAEVLHGEVLTSLGVARLAAGRYLEAISRAFPPEVRGALHEAADRYREIHESDSAGGVWGTGLFPEVAECLQTEGEADPEKHADPALRDRAADLLMEIRALESAALDALRRLPPT